MTKTPSRFLSYGRQYIDQDDLEAVNKVLQSDALTQGPAVQNFEQSLKDYFRVPFATACNSGTAALHMAAMAMSIGPGDVVIVSAMTFAATANAVRYTGADVVFADCDPLSGLTTLNHVEEALTHVPTGKKAKAVFCVHMNGHCTDMPSMYQFCKDNDLFLLEDACHALGTTYADGSPVGSCHYSDIAIFSFHPVKTIAMGEGGAVTTRHADLAAKIALYVTHGITKKTEYYEHQDMASAPWYHEMQVLGFNYRASDINCALAVSQMKKLDFFCNERKRLIATYRNKIQGLSNSVRMIEPSPYCDPVFHLNAVLIDFKNIGITRTELMNELKNRGIGTQVHYIPVYQHPYYQKTYPQQKPLPGAENYYQNVLSLPLFVGMTDNDVEYVVNELKSIITRERTDRHAAAT